MYADRLRKGESIGDLKFGSEKLTKAYNLAAESHRGQIRKSGEPYYYHCVEVMKILHDEWGIKDENYLVAALLHDAVEDTSITIEQIKAEFGDEVAELVEGVTKLSGGTDKETLSKVMRKTYLNPGVAVLKLSDRLHNMRTLEVMKPEQQRDKSQETLDVYTKLAESLGMWEVKVELEDLCFKYLNPEVYEATKKQVGEDPRTNPLFTNYIKSRVDQLLTDNDFKGKTEIRKNGYWVLKEKQGALAMNGEGNPEHFGDINDFISLRVCLGSKEEIYAFLKIVHDNMGAMVDYARFDEFLGANRRINGYQAIQTTVNFPQGPVEIALVTPEMEEFNNQGVVSLIRRGETDLKDYVLKLVFTPTNSLRFLPKEATGVDFAAILNPRILAEARAMKIDGVEKPLSTVIPNASTVEILIGETRRAPLTGVEAYASLPQTRKLIAEQRRLEKRDELIARGREKMEAILAPRGLLEIADLGEALNPILYNLGCQGSDDLHFMLGRGSIKAEELDRELQAAGVTKENLRMTTLKLKGQDGPGILMGVVGIISQTNKNIAGVEETKRGGNFQLRILVEGLTPEEEEVIRKKLETDGRFTTCVVV